MRPESVLGSGLASPRLRRSLLSNRWLLRRERERPAARCPLPASELPFDPQIKRNNFRISSYIVAALRVSLLQLRNLSAAFWVSAARVCPGSKCRQQLEVQAALRRAYSGYFSTILRRDRQTNDLNLNRFRHINRFWFPFTVRVGWLQIRNLCVIYYRRVLSQMTQRIAWDAFEDLKYKLFFIYRISSQIITNLSLVTFKQQ